MMVKNHLLFQNLFLHNHVKKSGDVSSNPGIQVIITKISNKKSNKKATKLHLEEKQNKEFLQIMK